MADAQAGRMTDFGAAPATRRDKTPAAERPKVGGRHDTPLMTPAVRAAARTDQERLLGDIQTLCGPSAPPSRCHGCGVGSQLQVLPQLTTEVDDNNAARLRQLGRRVDDI